MIESGGPARAALVLPFLSAALELRAEFKARTCRVEELSASSRGAFAVPGSRPAGITHKRMKGEGCRRVLCGTSRGQARGRPHVRRRPAEARQPTLGVYLGLAVNAADQLQRMLFDHVSGDLVYGVSGLLGARDRVLESHGHGA